MAKQSYSTWLISPKTFIKLLGAEYDLLKKSGGSVLKRFYYAAILVTATMIITFLSIRYAINLLFHVTAVEIVLSIFISLLFGFIYILLVNTFTKEKKELRNEISNFSNITRIAFVIFMGFIISKPVEIYAFKDLLEQDVEEYKIDLLKSHIQKVNALFENDLVGLQKRIDALRQKTFLKDETDPIKAKINSITKKKKELIAIAQAKISVSSFFIYRIKNVSMKYPFSWLVCGFVIVLFLLPGFLIYSISAEASYFKFKNAYEKEIIGKEFTAFSKKYSSLFLNNFDLDLQFYTRFSDPPFNTKPKEDHAYKSSNDFHHKFNID